MSKNQRLDSTVEIYTKFSDEETQGPNPVLQPFAHQAYKIIGMQLKFYESKPARRSNSATVEFLKRYFSSFWGTLGLIMLMSLIICSVVIPLFSQDPLHTDVFQKYNGFVKNGHFLGTDKVGRDLWARLWHGLRFSFGLSAFVTIVDLFIGVFAGILMGKFRKFDVVMQGFIKVVSNIPTIMLLIIIVIIFGASFWTLVLAMTMFGWIGMAQQIRSQTRRITVSEWNDASKILGTPQRKQVMNLIPHLIPMIITQLVFTIPGAILSETSLSFIGLSLKTTPTLGSLISEGANIFTRFPRYVLVPSFFLITVVASIQFIGNTTQDSLRRAR